MRTRLLPLLLLAAVPASAEVSITRLSGGAVEFHFEPSASGPWSRVRPEVPTGDMLNPQGDGHPDSWPSVALNANGLPSVAFASPGYDAEVYLAWHDGVAWRPPVNVSRRAGSDEGATVVLDEWGNRFIAWNHTRANRYAVRFTGVSNNGVGMLGVSELSCRQDDSRRPSLAVAPGGDVYVAYEESPVGTDTVPSVAIDRLSIQRESDRSLHCSGENTPDLWRSKLIRTNLTDRLLLTEPKVHSEDGHLWVTWIDNRNRVGYVELVSPGVFGDPSYRTFDPSLGPASALGDVRDDVLAP